MNHDWDIVTIIVSFFVMVCIIVMLITSNTSPQKTIAEKYSKSYYRYIETCKILKETPEPPNSELFIELSNGLEDDKAEN
ncbi:MAG: hypothetical protein ACPGTS_02085 [Minisyncoccia bacterium]